MIHHDDKITNNMTPKKVIISGGGTGGHIFPALSIANALRRRDPSVEILFVGAKGRMEMERVPAAGYKIEGLEVMGFDRRRLWRNFKVMWNMAQKLGIPTLIQEQNSYAGVTNKLLSKKAGCICVAYDNMERFFPADKIVKTGNPVRDAITQCNVGQKEAKKQLGFDPERPLVAVVGGSLGARTINESVKAAMDAILDAGAQILWQTGKYYADECLPLAKGKEGIQAMPFVSRMDLVYRAADLIVSRAGASTISELQIVGAPAILIPSPNVAEDHQRKNAQALADRNAAVMILDRDAVANLAGEVTRLLAAPTRLQSLRDTSRQWL